MSNKKLSIEFHKPVTIKFNKRKVHLIFIGNIWGSDLADMQLIYKFDKGISYLLCFIAICNTYAFAILLKDKNHG